MLKPNLPIIVYSSIPFPSNNPGTFIFQSDVHTYMNHRNNECVTIETAMDRIVKIESVDVAMVFWAGQNHFDVVHMKDKKDANGDSVKPRLNMDEA